MGISTAFCWNETVDETMTLLLLLLTCELTKIHQLYNFYHLADSASEWVG